MNSLEQYILKLNRENKDLKSQLKERDYVLNEIDHADYCMCRYCAPDFYNLKTSKTK